MHNRLVDFDNFKIEVFIPPDYLDALRETLGNIGVGRIGNYDNCGTITEVIGYWRPLVGSRAYQGQPGKLENAKEYKVEVNCKRELVSTALKAIREIHPYEEPVINVIPIANNLFY